jgi:assimilatory nitrate reductase catalytic subunit
MVTQLRMADSVVNQTTELAHAALPVTQWAEEDGTTTNLEGRVIRGRRAAAPHLESEPTWRSSSG